MIQSPPIRRVLVPPEPRRAKQSGGHEHRGRKPPFLQLEHPRGHRASIRVVERDRDTRPSRLADLTGGGQFDCIRQAHHIGVRNKEVELGSEVPLIDVEAQVTARTLPLGDDVVVRQDDGTRSPERAKRSSQARPGTFISARSRSRRPGSIASIRQKSSASPTARSTG